MCKVKHKIPNLQAPSTLWSKFYKYWNIFVYFERHRVNYPCLINKKKCFSSGMILPQDYKYSGTSHNHGTSRRLGKSPSLCISA